MPLASTSPAQKTDLHAAGFISVLDKTVFLPQDCVLQLCSTLSLIKIPLVLEYFYSKKGTPKQKKKETKQTNKWNKTKQNAKKNYS